MSTLQDFVNYLLTGNGGKPLSYDQMLWETRSSPNFNLQYQAAVTAGLIGQPGGKDLASCSPAQWSDALGRVMGPGSTVPPFNPFDGAEAKRPDMYKDIL